MSDDIDPRYLGMPVGIFASNGREYRVGDVLDFDEREWGGPCRFTLGFEKGAVTGCGSPSDWREWCTLHRAWDAESSKTFIPETPGLYLYEEDGEIGAVLYVDVGGKLACAGTLSPKDGVHDFAFELPPMQGEHEHVGSDGYVSPPDPVILGPLTSDEVVRMMVAAAHGQPVEAPRPTST